MTADVRVAALAEIEAAARVIDQASASVVVTVPPPRHVPEPVRAPDPVRATEPDRATEPVRATEPELARERPAEPVHPAEPVRATEPELARERPAGGAIDPSRPLCTQAQLRRFIKSRPWVPMHELRRRFGIYGDDDDVSPIRVGDRTLFIGLPPSEGWMMGELLSAGDVGCELSLDPVAPIVIGVYPMRPVPRS